MIIESRPKVLTDSVSPDHGWQAPYHRRAQRDGSEGVSIEPDRLRLSAWRASPAKRGIYCPLQDAWAASDISFRRKRLFSSTADVERVRR